jgi:hypothetical protein
MFLVTKHRMEIEMSDLLLQLMTGAVKPENLNVVYDNISRQAGKNTIMILVDGNKPVMLQHEDADEFRNYLQSSEESSVNKPIKLRLISRVSA